MYAKYIICVYTYELCPICKNMMCVYINMYLYTYVINELGLCCVVIFNTVDVVIVGVVVGVGDVFVVDAVAVAVCCCYFCCWNCYEWPCWWCWWCYCYVMCLCCFLAWCLFVRFFVWLFVAVAPGTYSGAILKQVWNGLGEQCEVGAGQLGCGGCGDWSTKLKKPLLSFPGHVVIYQEFFGGYSTIVTCRTHAQIWSICFKNFPIMATMWNECVCVSWRTSTAVLSWLTVQEQSPRAYNVSFKNNESSLIPKG